MDKDLGVHPERRGNEPLKWIGRTWLVKAEEGGDILVEPQHKRNTKGPAVLPSGEAGLTKHSRQWQETGRLAEATEDLG